MTKHASLARDSSHYLRNTLVVSSDTSKIRRAAPYRRHLLSMKHFFSSNPLSSLGTNTFNNNILCGSTSSASPQGDTTTKLAESIEDQIDLGPLFSTDPQLASHEQHFKYRSSQYQQTLSNIKKYDGSLEQFALGYKYYGFTRGDACTIYREWAPGASAAQLIGDFNGWTGTWMEKNEFGVWSVTLPDGAFDHHDTFLSLSSSTIAMHTPYSFEHHIIFQLSLLLIITFNRSLRYTCHPTRQQNQNQIATPGRLVGGQNSSLDHLGDRGA